jgi:uncharacterized BrkB/YihY/UPF0761 family membrane protein
MRGAGYRTRYIASHPIPFIRSDPEDVSREPRLLLAGAVAYYALLSIVPLLILSVIALSQVIDPAELLRTLARIWSGWYCSASKSAQRCCGSARK